MSSSRSARAAICDRVAAPLRVAQIDVAAPDDDEIMVRTKSCAVCHSDIAFVEGKWGPISPTVFGHEIAGVVEEVGRTTRPTVRPGDHVLVSLIRSCGTCRACRAGNPVLCESTFALDRRSPLSSAGDGTIGHGLRCGGFAERVTVHASQVVPIPADVPFAAAAVVACAGITGIGAVLNTADLPSGQHVAVIGTGGVGINTVQGAALRSPASLIAVDVSDEKLSVAQTFGASHAVRASDPDTVAAVRDLTEGRGADYVFVTVGASQAVTQALEMTARGGTVVLVGMPATGATIAIEPANVANDEIRVLGSKMGSSDPHRDIPRILRWYREGKLQLDELVSRTFPLEQINEAFDAARRAETVRVAIEFG